MKILAIDTSCDDTAVAVVDDLKILSNEVSSQARYHKKFGGVVPFLAKQLHAERIDTVVAAALQRAKLDWKDIEAIAVTHGPGLAPALEVGIQKAKELAKTHQLPLYAINHVSGHIASCYNPKTIIEGPVLALVVSGGHTELVLFEQFGEFIVLGETLDDAVGESFDKVAKMLGLGYPGGRTVSKLAESGRIGVYELPIPMQKRSDLNFSYSGLKNAVRLLIYQVKDGTHHHVMEAQEMQDICAAFQEVALEALMLKLKSALKQHPEVKSLLLVGGVASNTVLRSKVRAVAKKAGCEVYTPPSLKLCTDNAAMIGLACSLGITNGLQPVDPEGLDRKPSLRIEK